MATSGQSRFYLLTRYDQRSLLLGGLKLQKTIQTAPNYRVAKSERACIVATSCSHLIFLELRI